MTLLLVGLAISFGTGFLQQKAALRGKLTLKRRIQLFLVTLVGFYFVSYILPSLLALLISLAATYAGSRMALKGAPQSIVRLGRQPSKVSARPKTISASLKKAVRPRKDREHTYAHSSPTPPENRFSNLA